MIYTTAIIGIVFIVVLATYFWKRSGFGAGRAFGNRIAAHIGMPRNVFHLLIAHGVTEPAGNILADLEQSTPDLEQASIALGPILSKGIGRMEARFGRQEMVDQVKPIVARLATQFSALDQP